VLPAFQLQVEPTGNDTATPGATFNLLANSTGGTPAETGLQGSEIAAKRQRRET
jgi:hypothetical protein